MYKNKKVIALPWKMIKNFLTCPAVQNICNNPLSRRPNENFQHHVDFPEKCADQYINQAYKDRIEGTPFVPKIFKMWS